MRKKNSIQKRIIPTLTMDKLFCFPSRDEVLGKNIDDDYRWEEWMNLFQDLDGEDYRSVLGYTRDKLKDLNRSKT